MITILPVNFNRYKRNNVSFKKSVKQIRDEAPNRELKKYIKWATNECVVEAVLEDGIPALMKYAERGPEEKQQVIKIIRDMAESDELQHTLRRDNMFNGYRAMPGSEGGQEYIDKLFPGGYLRAYNTLTGERLNIVID